MRQLLMALILVLPAGSSARAASAGEAVFDKVVQGKCTKPDSQLIKPGTSDTYNAQAKGFNDCLRIYVENENNKIARIQDQANSEFDRIKESSTVQIRDIERAINTAIIEVRIVNGEAQASDLPPPGVTPASFPAAACNKPDDALLRPVPGKRAVGIQNTDRYESQRLAYEACMRSYIVQAKNEIEQIKVNAGIAFHRVAEDANPRITQINDDVTQALNDASKAAGERNAAVNAFRAPLQASGLNPAASQPGGFGPVAFQPAQNPRGAENVTVNGERLPRSPDMPTGTGDPDAISCRMPQQLTGSHLMGPEICKRNRDWAKLYKEGKNLSPDGTQIVKGERERTFNPQSCITNFTVPNHPDVMVTTCGTPGGQ